MNNLIEFDVATQTYSKAGYVTSDCNAITFLNLGTNPVTIDQNVILQTGQQLQIDGNQGEVTGHKFYVNFSGAASGNQLVVIRKLYLIQ
jgi:hypothetical protein